VFAATRSVAGSWSDPAGLAGPGASRLDLAVGGGGAAVAVWVADCRAFAARRPAGGAWQPALSLDADDACGESPGAAVDAAGNAVAAWRRWSGTGRVLRVADLPSGAAAWTGQRDLGAAGRSGGYIDPPVVSLTRQGGGVALWRDDAQAIQVAARTPGGVWSAPTPVPGLTGTLDDVAGDVAPDGTVVIFQASVTNFPRAVVREAGGAWSAPVGIATTPPQLSGFAAASVRLDDAGDAVLVSLDPGPGRAVTATELTGRDGPRAAAPLAVVTGLTAPSKVPAGAVARLTVTLDRPAEHLLLTVLRLVGSSWVAIGQGSVADAVSAEIPVRLSRPGTAVLRVRWAQASGAAALTAPRTVTVTRPGRRRLPAGLAPRAIAVGEGGLWVLGTEGGEATVRRIDQRTGRQVGATIRVGGRATAIAAGAGAVWVVRYRSAFDGTTELLRIDPKRTVGGPTPLPGSVTSVTAGAAGVWVGGVCMPLREPPGCRQQAAARIDSARGALSAIRVVPVGGQAETVRVIGRTLWAWGQETDDYDNTVLARADAVSGHVARSTRFGGRFGVPLVPVSASAVWRIAQRSISTAYPRDGEVLYQTRGYPTISATAAGRLVWVLESRTLLRGGATAQLLPLDARSGAPTGRPIELGLSVRQDQSVAVTSDAIWVLRPLEGALMRIPIPAALRG
jgi:hypothetical protein